MSLAQPSLTRRLTRSLLWAIALAWTVVACSSAWYAQVEINENMDAALVDSGHRLLGMALHELTPLANPHAAPTDKVQRGDTALADDYLAYQVVDSAGRVLLRSQDAPATPWVAGQRNGFTTLPLWRVYTYQHPEQPLAIQVADTLAHRKEAQWEITLWLLVPVVAVLPVLALWIPWTIRRQLAPLQHISTQIGLRSGHNLAAIPGTALPAELQTITNSMNRLLARLADALDTERALAANAAHELRTPLATTVLRLHALLDLPLQPPARLEARRALDSLNQLNRRAEKLLQMSRAESAAALTDAQVNLVSLAGTVAQEFWAQAGLLDRLHLHVPQEQEEQDVQARGDFDALAIVLRNLVENALRYSDGSAVHITVEAPATLRVRDLGPGLPPEMLERVRHRHVKNTPNAAGYGLGMSIVTTIVERHQGRLELASPPPGQAHGFEAVVRLPA